MPALSLGNSRQDQDGSDVLRGTDAGQRLVQAALRRLSEIETRMSTEPQDPWPDEEFDYERDYRYTERLGILCEDRAPTPEQEHIARTEADAWRKEHEN